MVYKIKHQTLLAFNLVFALVLASCGAPRSFPPEQTPVYIPIIVTAEVPIVITATPAPVLTSAPTPTSLPVMDENLEEDAGKWGVYPEGSPTWTIENVESPALMDRSLKCSLTGGETYSNVHCYRNLPSEPDANTLTLNLKFQFTPNISCDNQRANDVVQAIEFTMNKWYQGKRYEFAVQWQNIGVGAPQWRYWDPSKSDDSEKWVPINSGIAYCLEGGQWHTLSLTGNIVDGQVHYQNLTIDNTTYNLDLTIPPAPAQGEEDRLAAAVQVDGNMSATPYDLYIDQVSFIRQSLPQIVDCNTIKEAKLNHFNDPVVSKDTKVTWTPDCTMVLQYHQNDNPIPIFDQLAKSGELDFSMLPPGKTEIKIWIPNLDAALPADSMFVIVK